MRFLLLLIVMVAMANAQQRRVPAPPQYKVKDDGSEAGPVTKPRPIFYQAPAAAAASANEKQEESGFVRPIDFSSLLGGSFLGAQATEGSSVFGSPATGGPLHAAPAIAPVVFQHSTHEFRPFGAEPQKAAAEESKGFVEPAVRFHSMFDTGAASSGLFSVKDFLTAHASSQKEIEERVNAAAEAQPSDRDKKRGPSEGGDRRAAATEYSVYHGGDEEAEEDDDESEGPGSRVPHGRPSTHRSSYSSSEEDERGPAQFGPSHSSSYSSSASSPEGRHGSEKPYSYKYSPSASSPVGRQREEKPYYGPDYSKLMYEEEEGDSGSAVEETAPEKKATAAATPKARGKNCKKVSKKVTPEDVGKGRFRRAAAAKPAMTCYVCEDPENGGSYESCAYGHSPADKSYFVSRAFSSNGKGKGKNKYRQRRYLPEMKGFEQALDAYASGTNSEEKSSEHEGAPSGVGDSKMAYEVIPGDSYDENFKRLFPEFSFREASASSPSVASASALRPGPETIELRGAEEEEDDGESGSSDRSGSASEEEKATDYGYKGPPAEFFLDTAQKKHLEKLVGEFSQKDRTACKKVMKDQMTCFQCVDEKGVQHEECMFVAKSDPKGRHLAYHELKEYRLVPDEVAEGRGIAAVAASAPVPSSLIFPQLIHYQGFREPKASPASLVNPTRVPAPSVAASENRKKVQSRRGKVEEIDDEVEKEGDATEEEVERLSPAEAAEADGVYADETVQTFDPVRKMHLPKYMLKKSEHEAVFEEFVKASHEAGEE